MKKVLSVLLAVLAFVSIAESECENGASIKGECENRVNAEPHFERAMLLDRVMGNENFLKEIGINENAIAIIKELLAQIKVDEDKLIARRRELFKAKANAMKDLKDRSNDGSAIKEINAKIEAVMRQFSDLQVDKLIAVRDNVTEAQLRSIFLKIKQIKVEESQRAGQMPTIAERQQQRPHRLNDKESKRLMKKGNNDEEKRLLIKKEDNDKENNKED